MKRFITLLCAVVLMLSLALPASALGDNDIILTNCDDSKNWAANSQGLDALETDSVNFTEGSGSIGATAINGKLNQIVYLPEEAIDVSGYQFLEFDIYFNDITWYNDCGSVMMEMTSSGTCDKESNRYMKTYMRNLFVTGAVEGKQNWWHFVLDMDNPQGTANGRLNKANFNYFRFYTVDPISTTPDYTFRIDNMRFTNTPDNYHPAEEEDETDSTGTASQDAVYVPERSDPNAGKVGMYTGILIGEGVAIVAAIVVIVVAALHIHSKKKADQASGGQK